MDKVYYNLQKTKAFTHKFDKDVPAIFKDFKFDKYPKDSVWIWGVGSNPDLDQTGERVILDPEVAKGLEKNGNLMLEHDKEGKNSGGIASYGTIEFSRVVPEMDNQHIIMARANEWHQNINNVVGSILNNNIPSFSVAGQASREHVINPTTNQPETIRRVHNLNETSMTSSPANLGSGITGVFQKNLKELEGNEIQKPEGNKMENENFVPKADFESLKSDFGKMQEDMKKGFEGLTKSNTDFISEMKKALEDDTEEPTGGEETTEPTGEQTPATDRDNPASGTTQTQTITQPELHKKVGELENELSTLKKSLPPTQGVAKNGRPELENNDNVINAAPLAHLAGINGC